MNRKIILAISRICTTNTLLLLLSIVRVETKYKSNYRENIGAATMNNVRKIQRNKLWIFLSANKDYGTIPRAFVVVNSSAKTSETPKTDSQKHKLNKKYFVNTRETTNTLHFNAENVREDIQALFAKHALEDIKKKVKKDEIKSISFNFIHENIFRCHLNMPIRKLEFNSVFQRYNDDKGLAVFFKRNEDEDTVDSADIGAYNERAFLRQAQGLL